MKKRLKAIMPMMLLAMVAMLGTGCSSSRQAVNTGGQDVDTTVKIGELAQYADWQTLVCSGKVSLAIGTDKSVRSSMQMKMIEGKSISISIRPLLGIEMARLYIANDEIVIIDRYHKVYVREKASLLTSGVPVDVSTLQDILLGRPHVLGKGTLNASMANDVTFKIENGTINMSPVEQYEGFGYGYVFNANRCVERLDVWPTGGEAIYSVNYAGIETTLAGKISTEVAVATKLNGAALSLDLSLKNFTWNTEFSDDVDIPAGYNEATGSSIIKALGGTVR
ncbi:MAG: DUF4292 domain-containing protein [Muribaculaceae bacterium]